MGQPRRGNNSLAMMCTLISYCVWHQLKSPEILQGRKGHTSSIAGKFYASRFKGRPGHSYGTKKDFTEVLFWVSSSFTSFTSLSNRPMRDC